MKKIYSLFLLLGLLLSVGNVWATDVTFTFADIASANNWENGTAYSPVSIAPITITAEGGGNNAKYYTSDESWRMYNGGSLLIEAEDGYEITAVSSNPSQTFTITNGAAAIAFTATVKFKSITVTYTTAASLLPNDLTLANSPVALSFDLYNNSDAQVINYTTSSTGVVTIEESTFATFSINETAKTITVTPNTITQGTQTITVNQAADETYGAGSKTFTLTIEDSTPFSGGDITFNAATDKGTSPLTKDPVTFACTSGVLNNGTEYRLYKNSNTTFSLSNAAITDGYKITSIAFTGVSGNPASGFANQDGWTINGNDGTWTGTSTSVTFTASGAQVRATKIVVTIEVNIKPSISTDNVNIAYDAVSGTIDYEINNYVAGTMVASTEADWISNFAYDQADEIGEVTFATTANPTGFERSAIVTLTYTYNTNQTVTRNVTVTQAANPNVVPTIADVRAQGTGDVETQGIVTSCEGTTGYIQDATAAICVYGTALTVGDEIRVSGTLSTYKGLLEITSPTVTVLSSDNPVEPVVKTISEITNDIQGLYIKIEDARVTNVSDKNVTIAQGENTIVVRFNATVSDIYENDILTLTGNVGCYTNAQIANPTIIPLKIGAGGWSTYAAAFNYIVYGASVYTAQYNGADAVVLHPVADNTIIPANAGIILGGEVNDEVAISYTTDQAATLSNNQLVGVVTSTAAPANSYVLSTFEDGTKFNPCEQGLMIPAHKAYLIIGGLNPAPGAIRIEFAENNATNIMSVDDVENSVKFVENGQLFIKKNGVIYNAVGAVVK